MPFFFLWQAFIMLFWRFFYTFFVLFIILSSFFFWVLFFCFLQDFLSNKPVIIHYYISTWQLIKKIFFLLIHNFIFIFHFHFHFHSHSHSHSNSDSHSDSHSHFSIIILLSYFIELFKLLFLYTNLTTQNLFLLIYNTNAIKFT